MLATMIYAAILSLVPYHHAVQSNDEVVIRQQVTSFYSYFSKGQYEQMWDMLSKKLQKGNEDNKEKYVEDLRRYGIIGVEFQIKGVHLEGNCAKVRLTLNLKSKFDKPPQWVRVEEEDTWILEDGQWHFDNFEELNSSVLNGKDTDR